MFCKNCGHEMNPGDKNCTRCGTPVEQSQVIYNQPVEEPKKKNNTKLIIGIVVGIIAIIVIWFIYNNKTSDKLECKSSQGDITILYKGEKLKGYKVKNASYDMDRGKELVNEYGMTKYLELFKEWFEGNSDGTCEYK